WKNVSVPGNGSSISEALEYSGRIADYLEMGELLVQDALTREESCGCHFREEYQTEENEAKRNDEKFSYVSAWEFQGVGKDAQLHKEPLVFENVQLSQRSYK
ncbi:MAG: fumarate reductase/succinate dehydrogenase flavoprotein subunit, partial [Planctomycetota bacterium]